MKKNKFDIVMDYIDANIMKDCDTLKKGIFNEIGYNSNTFGNCFKSLTDQTLGKYISERKMYFAAQELKNDLDKDIIDIALAYGYSDQSAFSRAFKEIYDATPNDVRKGKVQISNNKKSLIEICREKEQFDERFRRIIKELNETGDLSMSNWDYLEQVEEARKEYGFDVDTFGAISDLAEMLEVPIQLLLRKCRDIVSDSQSDPEYLSPKDEMAIDCGIKSRAELDVICKFYNCKYYDLDETMVDAYRKQLN